jgi:hypothetical protein
VTTTLFPPLDGEWQPSADSPDSAFGGTFPWEIRVHWDDFLTNPRNTTGRHLGVKVLTRAIASGVDPWDEFIIFEFGITYDKDQCDIPGHSDYLDSLFLGLLFDCDVSGSDQTDPHIDDLVDFDGWVNGEWANWGYPWDSITISPDSFWQSPDGYFDQYTVYGDDPWEPTLHGEIEIVPRNLSYMYDGDNPGDPGDDSGENGMSEGYIGLRLLYAPPSPADSIWVDEYGDTARIPRVYAHQWWNWESDPATDADMYHFMNGTHPASSGLRYCPHPYWVVASVDDYRFLQSVGPFRLYDGDTLWFVFVCGVGEKLSGGYNGYWFNQWKRGLRQVVDYALAAYYSGSQHSDPYHPSGPHEDIHWQALTGISERTRTVRPKVAFPTVIEGKELLLSVKDLPWVQVQIFDVCGRLRYKEKFVTSGYSLISIPIKNLPTGLYFVEVKGTQLHQIGKIIYIK